MHLHYDNLLGKFKWDLDGSDESRQPGKKKKTPSTKKKNKD